MSAASVEIQWYDEPLDVTPDREERLYEWAAGYAGRIRDMWADNGEDVTTSEAQDAYRYVAYSMLVPERPTWMPLGRAFSPHRKWGQGRPELRAFQRRSEGSSRAGRRLTYATPFARSTPRLRTR